MAEMSGQYDYRPPTRQRESMVDDLPRTMQEVGERAGDLASDVAATVRERPYTAMAIAGGLAFAVGALWMLSRRQRQSPLDSLLARLPDMPKREALEAMLPRRWR